MSKHGKTPPPYPPLWQDPSPQQIPEPWPPPGPYSDRGQWKNPAGTLPFPAPQQMPIGCWTGQTQFVNVPVGGQVTIGSPVFDLRPELRASDGRLPAPAVPIWKPSTITGGAGGKLWVQFFNTDTVVLGGLIATAQGFGSIQDVTQMVTCDAPEDVSGEFVSTAQSTIMTFVPVGAGYPVRFWQLRITIASDPGVGNAYQFPVHMAYY